jgi:carbon-monoxide dehydrogenase medium subunit
MQVTMTVNGEPVTDMRGSAEYKHHLASELTVRTLRTAVERVRNAPAVEGN